MFAKSKNLSTANSKERDFMRKTVISILSVLLMLLLSGCGQIAEDYFGRYKVATGSVISDISVSSVESETAPEVVTTTVPTTTEVTSTFEPVTSPEVTTAPEVTTTPVSTVVETTTQFTTTVSTAMKAAATTEASTTVTTTATTTEIITAEPEIEVVPESADVLKMAREFLELLNSEREKAGICALVTGPVIQEMAQIRAEELPTRFDHTRPNGLSYLSVCTEYGYGIPTGYYGTYATGVQYEIYYRENAGETVGRMDSTHPEVMIESFRNSAGHWRVLMDPTLGAVGVAVFAVEDETYGYLYYYEVLLTDKLYE